MSTQALHRVYVRMLFDPAFVARVHEETATALADVPLTDRERTWLLACDRRLFTADPLRRRRSLKALLDEFKASSALVVGATGRLATLDAFFSSRFFHECIQDRRSLALSYADYLGSLATHDPRIGAVAAIERAIAEARRGRVSQKQPPRFTPEGRYVLAPHVALARVPAGSLAAMQAVEQVLFEISLAPVAALADDGPNLSGVPRLQDGPPQRLLAVRGEGDHVSLEDVSDELADLLEASRTPVSGATLAAVAQRLGAAAGEEAEVVQPLLADRLLVAA